MGILSVIIAAGQYMLDHLFSWLKLLFVFLFLDTIFRAFVLSGWLEELTIVLWYVENETVFKFFPEVAITYMLNMFMLFVSLGMLFLVMHRKETGNHSTLKK